MAKLTLLTFFIIAATTQAAKFPSKWTKCPKLNNEECLKKAIQDAVISLKDGNKDLNVIPLDPLHFERMELNQGKNGPVTLNLTLYNLDMIGSSRIRINSAKVDWDKYNMEVDATVMDGPAFLIGDYTSDGKILVLPMKGKGKANITLENFSVLLGLNGKEMTKNGKKYFQVEKGSYVIRSPKVHLQFENMLGENPEIGRNMQAFLNENSELIMAELNSTISDAIGLAVKEVANNFFKKIPVTDLYTE